MKPDTSEVQAVVHKLPKQDNQYIWDFGSFKLIGSEEHPHRLPMNLDSFGPIINGVDGVHIRNQDPHTIESVTVYEGDYVIYIPTEFTKGEYHISPEGSIYKEITRKVEHDDKQNIVLKLVDQYNKKEIIRPVDVIESKWKPVIKII